MSILFWYKVNWLVGIGIFLFFYIALGVVLSKMRISSVPVELSQEDLSDNEIIKWFVIKNIF